MRIGGDNNIKHLLAKALCENKQDAVILLFNLRDCRGGKGERELFREGWCVLCEHLTVSERTGLFRLISEYGRFNNVCRLANDDDMCT